MGTTTQNSRIIKAPAEKIYKALTTPEALVFWRVPGNMTGKVHRFNLAEGDGYEMSLFYPEDETNTPGKTAVKEDRFTSKYVALNPPYKLIEVITFETDNPDFSGEMIMEVMPEPIAENTCVTFQFNNIPNGIRPEDNEEGTRSSLEKLAKYVE